MSRYPSSVKGRGCDEKDGKEFLGGSAGSESGIVTAVARVTAMVQVQSLARELPGDMGVAKKGDKSF